MLQMLGQLVQISRSLDAAGYSTRTGLLRDVVDWRLSRWDSSPSLEEPCDFGPISLPSCLWLSLLETWENIGAFFRGLLGILLGHQRENELYM